MATRMQGDQRRSRSRRGQRQQQQQQQQQQCRCLATYNFTLVQLISFLMFGIAIRMNYNNLTVGLTTILVNNAIEMEAPTTVRAASTSIRPRLPLLNDVTRNGYAYDPATAGGSSRTSSLTITCPYPLVPIYDRIVFSDADTATTDDAPTTTNTSSSSSRKEPPPQKITKSIHMAWIRGRPGITPEESRCISRDQLFLVQTWKDQFPSYNFYFHDDYAVNTILSDQQESSDAAPGPLLRARIEQDFPQYTKIMHHCVQFGTAMRIDIWRILLLYYYGGVYCDFDMGPGPNLTETLPELVMNDTTAFFLTAPANRPSQWMFGVEPYHPIMYYTMWEILHSLQELDNIAEPKLVWTTGPDALQRGYIKALGKGALQPGLHPTYHTSQKLYPLDNVGELIVPPALQKNVRKMPPTANTGLALRSYIYDQVPWPRLTITINQQTGEEIEALAESTTRTRERKYRIEQEMNTTHWLTDIRLQKNTVRSGRCIDHLYRDST